MSPDDAQVRYRIVRKLARGGGGTVWEAYDRWLERPVALKRVEVPPELPARERRRLRARTSAEARAAARLSHPGAVRIFDVVDRDDAIDLVMELVEDPTLEQLVEERGPLPDAEVARLGGGLLQVLEAAHAEGIIHRDVKPGNVFVTSDGRPRLTDFGIAALSGETSLTRTGATMGSPQYLAPEQATGDDPLPATDLWGLGATLYFAVEGEPPFRRDGAIATVHAVVHDEPRPCSRAVGLGGLLGSLLRKDAAARPPPDVVRAQLAAVAAGVPGPASIAPEPASVAREPASVAPEPVVAPEPAVSGATGTDARPPITGTVPLDRPRRPTAAAGSALAGGTADDGRHGWAVYGAVAVLVLVLTFVLLVLA